jgi:hypothetical protein
MNYNPCAGGFMANQVKGNRCNVGLRRRAFALTTLILMLSMRLYSEPKNSANTAASIQPFLGRWDLTLKTPLREYPSWLEVTQEDGRPRARMVGRWGHARPLPKCELANGRITVVHNGKTIHRNREITAKTGGGKQEGPAPLAIQLQDHGNPVAYRNIWIMTAGDNGSRYYAVR